MIIRLTVNDNDFGYLMNTFVCCLGSRISQVPANIKNLDVDAQMMIIDEIDKVSELLNPNFAEKHTEDEKALIKEKIIKAFAGYVYAHEDKDTAGYLIREFKVEFLDSVEDKWENGEAFYWFQHSRAVINQ